MQILTALIRGSETKPNGKYILFRTKHLSVQRALKTAGPNTGCCFIRVMQTW